MWPRVLHGPMRAGGVARPGGDDDVHFLFSFFSSDKNEVSPGVSNSVVSFHFASNHSLLSDSWYV